MSDLPIEKLQQDFSAAISRSDLVVEAPTGSGKSTRQTLSFGTCMAPVEPRMLAEAGLGEIEYGAPAWSGWSIYFKDASRVVRVR